MAEVTLPEGLCQICTVKPWDEKRAALEVQGVREVQRLARLPLSCASCDVSLPETGVRWWVDRRGKECTWHGHPGWCK